MDRNHRSSNMRIMNFLKVFLSCLLAVVVGSILTFLFWLFVLLGIAGSMEKSVVAVKPHSILKIDFAEVIADSPVAEPFAQVDFQTFEVMRRLPLLGVLRAIETAKEDPRIEGIYLRMNGMGGVEGTAILEELRAALADFKRSGKFVVSYNETYSQGQYYLATVADRIYLQPEGAMDWRGLAMNVFFYKGLFDKLDLKAEVFRPTACKYKSAVEPYILTKMSDANRMQMQALADSMWGTVVEAVSEARGIAPDRLNELADRLQVTLPEDALRYGFIDGLIYEDGMDGVFADLGAKPDREGSFSFVTLGEYVSQAGSDLKNISAAQIAVVYADGAIVDGEGTYGDVYGNTLAQTLEKVRRDARVKAVVLRVNSPGGSALASDVIWRQMELLRAEKPVIVSMGSYAASGGYYISCPADAIVADRMTLTGSIGVFGIYLNTVDALRNKLGITIDGVKTNTSSNMGVLGALTPAERASVMRGVDKVYTTFTEHVAEGRNLPLEKVLDIAGGRVWTGADARDIGLVDVCGGLREAIAVAADKAELKGGDFRITEVLEEPETFMMLLSSLFSEVKARIELSELGVMMKEYRKVQEAAKQTGIVMYEPRTFVAE